MIRNLRHWMNEASRRNYAGPTEGLVVLDDLPIVRVPHLDNWSESHGILSTIDADKVIASLVRTTTKDPKWSGTAQVVGLDGTYNVYATDADLNACLNELLGKRAAVLLETAETKADPKAALAARLKDHDWYYCYSDDGSVFRAGEQAWRKIEALIAKLDPTAARSLWSVHAPPEFAFPTK